MASAVRRSVPPSGEGLHEHVHGDLRHLERRSKRHTQSPLHGFTQKMPQPVSCHEQLPSMVHLPVSQKSWSPFAAAKHGQIGTSAAPALVDFFAADGAGAGPSAPSSACASDLPNASTASLCSAFS